MKKEKRSVLHFILIFAFVVCTFVMGQEAIFAASAPYATGYVNDVDGANIRSTYSTEGRLVGSAPYQGALMITKERFTSATDTDKTTRWVYVQSGYGNGWIRADLLDFSYDSITGVITESLCSSGQSASQRTKPGPL